MAVFYSFHYEHDVNRVQLVKNIGAVEGQPLLNSQGWEQVRRGGDAAIEEWIDDQMKWKSAVIVLIGKQTASRDWVQYEIEKAWNEKRPLLGIRIHGLSSMGTVDTAGANPFDKVSGVSGIPIFDPTQTDWAGNTDSKATYNYLKDHLKTWATQGKKRLW
jgi:hypothetical protein